MTTLRAASAGLPPPGLRDGQDLLQRLRQRFPQGIEKAEILGPRRLHFTVARERLVEVCTHLRDHLQVDHLSLVSAVDWKDRFENVYHLVSYPNRLVIEVHVTIPKDDPTVDTLVPVWNSANVHEREAFDLMGIVFQGHPNLTRILMPKDFKFFPLRKDFKSE